MMQIPIDRIRKPAKTRTINAPAMKNLMDSFASAGQICPIILKRDRLVLDRKEEGYLLIAGNHRLEAAIGLGWTTIGAEVYDEGHNAVHLELIEVDENLCRSELTAAQKASALKKRKILWESLREQNLGGNQIPTQVATEHKDRPQNQPGFAASTAEVTGMSKRAINDYIRIADQLGDLLEDIQGTELDSKPKMQELVKLSEEARMAIIQSTVPMIAKATISKPKKTPAEPDPDKMVEKFIKDFNKLDQSAQLQIWESIKELFEDDD